MIELDIPGFRHLRLEHLVFDFNGALVFDVAFHGAAARMLGALSATKDIHVLTDDTYGTTARQLGGEALPNGDRRADRAGGSVSAIPP